MRACGEAAGLMGQLHPRLSPRTLTDMKHIAEYFSTGGIIMLPIAICFFLLCHRYFAIILKQKENTAEERHFIAALAAALPLLGLLGTVIGIMETFQSNSGANAQVLASGIGKALITTQAGLASAVTGTLALAHLKYKAKKGNAA